MFVAMLVDEARRLAIGAFSILPISLGSVVSMIFGSAVV